MTKYELRRLAERVAGFPEQDIDLVPSPEGTGQLVARERAAGSTPSADAVVTIAGDASIPNRKAITLSADREIVIHKFHGGPRTYTLADCDLVCTSAAAFEKFFLPYYLPLMTPEQFARFRMVMDDPEVLCVVHLPTSEPSLGERSHGGEERGVAFGAESSTFVVTTSAFARRFSVGDDAPTPDSGALVGLSAMSVVAGRN